MRAKTYILASLLVMTSVAQASDFTIDSNLRGMNGHSRDAKVISNINSIRNTEQEIKAINKDGVVLAERQTNLLTTANTIFNGWANFEKERQQHIENTVEQHAYTEKINKQIEAYNVMCHDELEQNVYDKCQVSKAQLAPLAEKVNSWKDAVDANRSRLLKTLKTLNQASDDLDRDSNEIHQSGLKYLGKYAKLTQRVKKLSTELDTLQVEYETCKSSTTVEAIHSNCGTMFDVNVVQMVETDYPVPEATFKFYTAPERCTPLQTFCLKEIK